MTRVQSLAAVVVNYDSGALATSCVASLIEGWVASGRARRELSIAVIDNASPTSQAAWFAQLAALGAEVVRAPENEGYARAVNRGARRLRAQEHDALAILNPDLLFPPGSVAALLAGLERNPGAGAVGPRLSFDPEGLLQLPHNEVPTPLTHWRDTLAQLDPQLGRAAAARRSRVAARVWSAPGDLALDTLSGACLLLPRAALEALDCAGPMDARFPLYFEDTDLCRRLAALGSSLVRIGDARVCHLWARSSGAGPELCADARARFLASRATWFTRTHGGLGRAFAEAADQLLAGWPAELRHRPIHAFQQLGSRAEAVELDLGRSGPFLLEVGLEATLGLAGGVLGTGASWRFPADVWDWLFRGPVYCRAFDRRDGSLLGAWTFHKSTLPRTAFSQPFVREDAA